MELTWYHYTILTLSSIPVFFVIWNNFKIKRPYIVLKSDRPQGDGNTAIPINNDQSKPGYNLLISFPFELMNHSPHTAYNVQLIHLKTSDIKETKFPDHKYKQPFRDGERVKFEVTINRFIETTGHERESNQAKLHDQMNIKILIKYQNMNFNRWFYTYYSSTGKIYTYKKVCRVKSYFLRKFK